MLLYLVKDLSVLTQRDAAECLTYIVFISLFLFLLLVFHIGTHLHLNCSEGITIFIILLLVEWSKM